MQKLILGALIFVVLGLSETTAQTCKKNEVSVTCGSCPKTCANMFSQTMVCNAMCKIGCVCQDGYVLNSKQDCILPEDCDPSEIKCPSGKIYSPTKSVQKTCQKDQTTTIVDDGKPGGCYCPDDLVFEENTQTCIQPDMCESTEKNYLCRLKDYNSEYVRCQSSSCIRTCERPNNPCITKDCRQGCYCIKGFAQDPTKNRCVPVAQCPSTTTATPV